MSICKEKPASLTPLDAIGIEPLDPSSLHLMRGGFHLALYSEEYYYAARKTMRHGLGLLVVLNDLDYF